MEVHFTPEQLAHVATKAGTDAEHLVRDVVLRLLENEVGFRPPAPVPVLEPGVIDANILVYAMAELSKLARNQAWCAGNALIVWNRVVSERIGLVLMITSWNWRAVQVHPGLMSRTDVLG